MRQALGPWLGPAGVTALEALSLLVGFLMQPYLMRVLGPAAFGSYVLTVSIATLAATLTDFGFNFAGVQRAIELSGDDVRGHRHFWCVSLCKAAVGAAALLVIVPLCVALNSPLALGIALASSAAVVAAVLFPTWWLLATDRLLLMAGALLVARTVGLGLVLWGVHGPEDTLWAATLTVGAPMLAAGLCLVIDSELRGRLRWQSATLAEWLTVLRLGASTAWVASLPSLSAALVHGLVGSLGSTATLGQYAAADKIRAAIQGLFTAFGHASFPGSVKRLRGPDAGAAWPLLKAQVLISATAALPLFVFADEVVLWVSGPHFDEAGSALRLLALALVSSTFVAALGVQVLLPLKLVLRHATAMLGGLAVHALALALLVPRWGAPGAAAALLVADACAALLMLRVLRAQPRLSKGRI